MSFLSRVPRPASSPPPECGGLSLCRPSGRLASTKQTSATAARRSPVPYARRPRSRLGNSARQSRSGGRHRFRRSPSPPVQARRFAATFPVSPSPAFIHARRTAPSQKFLPYLPASTGPAAFRADPDHASVVRKSNKLQKEAATASLRLAVAAEECSICVFQLSGLWSDRLKRRTGFAAPPTVTPNSPPSHQR